MGAIHDTAGGMRDLITEQVACKSGLLLTHNEALTILRRAEYPDLQVFEEADASYVRIRSEDVEDLIITLRHRVGNLRDTETALGKQIQFIQACADKKIDPGPMIKALGEVVDSGKYRSIDKEATEEIVARSGMPENIVADFLFMIAESQDLSTSWTRAKQDEVKWAIPLNDLFQSEHIPADPEVYFDQRYIDYLVSNSEDLERIQWRNFERLTGEFFARRGYDVSLGPGGDDGGIDVRVWIQDAQKMGPPLLVIQCKRHKDTHDVEINTVKAFWTDVEYEGAHRGLIATTSRIAPGGLKVSRARRWPLGFAENKQIQHWVRTMWRHRPLKDAE